MSELSATREGSAMPPAPGGPGPSGAAASGGGAAAAGAGGAPAAAAAPSASPSAATAGGGAAQGGPTAFSYIGQRISLISRSQIRYEGVLYTIDTNRSEVALQNVMVFGTENRHRPEGPVAPQGAPIEFVIFHGRDILDLQVLPPPPSYFDPAIVRASYQHQKAPASATAPARGVQQQQLQPPQQQLPPPRTHDVQYGGYAPSPVQAMASPPHVPQHMMPQRMAHAYSQPMAYSQPQAYAHAHVPQAAHSRPLPQAQVMPQHGVQPHAQAAQPSPPAQQQRRQVPAGGQQAHPATQQRNGVAVHTSVQHSLGGPAPCAPTMPTTTMVDATSVRPQGSTGAVAAGANGVQPGGLRPLPPGMATAPATTASLRAQGAASQGMPKWGPPPHARTWGTGGVRTPLRTWGGGGNGPVAGATGAGGERRGRGRRTRRRGPGLEVPKEDYDFEEMHNKFDKAALDDSAAAPVGHPAIAQPYDKSNGFFDQLVPEKQMPRERINAAQRRATDMETFGEVGNVHRHARYRGGRGRRHGGGRNRHRPHGQHGQQQPHAQQPQPPTQQ